MIRVLHTSDWHLGRLLYGRSLLEDQSACLDRLIELIDRVRPHAVLIAGDIFDRPLPPEAAVALFDRFLNATARDRGIPLFIIPGNHDSSERLSFASSLLRRQGVTIFGKVEDAFHPVRIQGDAGAEALVFGIPYVEPFAIAHALGRPELDTPDAAMHALCEALAEVRDEAKVSTSSQLPSLLLAHALVTGGETSESERELFIGGASAVDAKAFRGFSYVALGHLHKPQRAGAENVRYSGSLFSYSKSETKGAKAINEVRLSAAGLEVIAHELPLRRKLRYVEGPLDELLAGPGDDDYLITGLTDRGAVLDAFSKLHKLYPRLLHVSRVAEAGAESAPASIARRAREGLSDLDLFADFFAEAAGSPLDEPERAALIEALQELERGPGVEEL